MLEARHVMVAFLVLSPALGAAQSGRPASTIPPIQCETLAEPESGLVGLVAISRGGHIAWTDGPLATSVHILTPGQATRTVSRSGEGPGEHRMVTSLGWRFDTLWTSDARLKRVTAFTSGGMFVRSLPVPVRGALVARDDTSFVGVVSPDGEIGSAVGGGPTVLGAVTAASGATVRYATLVPARLQDPLILQTLQPVTKVAASQDGARWCAIGNGAESATQLVCVSSAGREVLRTALSLPPRPLATAVWDEELAAFARRMGVPPSAVTDQFTRPRSTVAAFDLMVNRQTEVWLARSRPSDPEAVWDRVSLSGAPLTPRSFPGRFQVRAVNGNIVYAADTDGDGMQALVKCRLAAAGQSR